jgi:transcription-repair coupling factor (superfamily II helicase)
MKSAELYVEECLVESDLELNFPADYVPDGSERILLYRELDGMERENDIMAFRSRLEDRFGKIPPQAEELIRLVLLRKMGKELGIEKIFLKGGRMSLFFISNLESPYYSSDAFGNILMYAANHPMECRLREDNGKRSILITNIKSVEEAIAVFEEIKR